MNTATETKQTVDLIAIDQLKPSKTNPRKNFAAADISELTESIRQNGILQPILVRPIPDGFEIVCGERRYRGAKGAGMTEMPCIVNADMTDEHVVQIQVVENLQRQDLHPLEEADGYRRLLQIRGYDAAKIAARIGRSAAYVYDRIKLLELIEAARKVFLAGEITAGHAVILSRLKPEHQKRALKEGLFEPEGGLFGPDDEGYGGGEKARSVKELQAWVDEHVKFDAEKADPVLFPETVQVLKVATEKAEKILPISHDHFVQRDARDGERVFGPRSWERADGKKGSKECEHSVTGFFVVGPQRGETLRVCASKEKCKVHWAAFHRERAARVKAKAAGGNRQAALEKKAEERRLATEAKDIAERDRWTKALPQIWKAMAEAIVKTPANMQGVLGRIVLEECRPNYGRPRELSAYATIGNTAEDLVRCAAFYILANDANKWNSCKLFPKIAKGLGVNIAKVLDVAVPKEKPVEKKAAKEAKK